MMRMQRFERVERPNTVAGLNAKRGDLVRYRQNLEAEVRKVTCDIDHIEAATVYKAADRRVSVLPAPGGDAQK
jgi:hypothetical protein